MLHEHPFVPGLVGSEPKHGVREHYRGRVDFRTLQGVEQVAFRLTRSPSCRGRTKRKLAVAFTTRCRVLATLVGVVARSPVGSIDHHTSARLLQRAFTGNPTAVDRKEPRLVQGFEGSNELAIGVVVYGRRGKHHTEPMSASVAHGFLVRGEQPPACNGSAAARFKLCGQRADARIRRTQRQRQLGRGPSTVLRARGALLWSMRQLATAATSAAQL